MSMHAADYQALLTKWKDWAKAHPIVVVAIVTAIVALLVGKFLL